MTDDDLTPAPRRSWAERRHAKIRAEVERNRRGDYRVPTWVLVVILVVLVAAWSTLVVLS